MAEPTFDHERLDVYRLSIESAVECVLRGCIRDRVRPKGFETALFRKPDEIRTVNGSRLASPYREKTSALTVGSAHRHQHAGLPGPNRLHAG